VAHPPFRFFSLAQRQRTLFRFAQKRARKILSSTARFLYPTRFYKPMLSKKAQTSTEYLIILAIVIIIALVVVAVMGGVPTLSSGSGAKIESAYWKTSDIGIQAVKMVSSGQDTVVVKNNLDVTAEITELLINDADITGGQNFTLSPAGTKALNASIGDGTAGDAFAYSVNVTYNDLDNDLVGLTFTPSENLKGDFQ